MIPFNKERCKERLLNEYLKHRRLIVAFDFDNTIFDYHNNGDDYSNVINLLRKCTELNFELVLFTVEEDEGLMSKKLSIVSEILGTSNFKVNESSIFKKAKKPYYNILLDDRAGLEESYEILKFVIDNADN